MGGVHVQFSLHLQYHDLGALEQGIEPPTAPRAPQHKMAAHCSGCVFTVCVCVHCSVCVHFGWVKCRARILSMGHHTWLNVTSLHFTSLHKFSQNVAYNQYIEPSLYVFLNPKHSHGDLQNPKRRLYRRHRSCDGSSVKLHRPLCYNDPVLHICPIQH